MATGPKWNRQRGCWFVRYWDGAKWRREKAADGPAGWTPDKPAPKTPPPEAFAELERLGRKEAEARERAAAGLNSPLRDFLDEHVEGYQKPLSREAVRKAVDQFLAFCDERGIRQIHEVDRRVCEAWVRHIGKTFRVNTVAAKKNRVGAAWGNLKRGHRIAVNPWDGIKTGGLPTIKGRKAWTPKQFEAILAEAKPWLADVIRVGCYTGLRIEALLKLEWRDIIPPASPEQKNGYVRVRPELDKAGRGYKVPISDRLKAVLDARSASPEKHATFVLTSAKGKPIYNRNVTGVAIKRACERAHQPIPESPNHHMRRSFGRWAVFGQLIPGKKIPLYVVSRWLGHSSVKTTMIYLDIEEEDSARFMVPD